MLDISKWNFKKCPGNLQKGRKKKTEILKKTGKKQYIKNEMAYLSPNILIHFKK